MDKRNVIILTVVVVILVALGVWYFATQGVSVGRQMTEQTNQRIATLEKEAENGTANQSTLFELAHSYLLVGNYDSAIKYYTQAIPMSSSSVASAALYLGEAYAAKGDVANAEEQLKNAITYAEANEQALPSARGVVVPLTSSSSQTNDQAIEREIKSGADATLAQASMDLASLYVKENKLNDAIAVLDNGILKVPSYADFYKELAAIYTQQGLAAPAAQFQSLYEAHASSTASSSIAR